MSVECAVAGVWVAFREGAMSPSMSLFDATCIYPAVDLTGSVTCPDAGYGHMTRIYPNTHIHSPGLVA